MRLGDQPAPRRRRPRARRPRCSPSAPARARRRQVRRVRRADVFTPDGLEQATRLGSRPPGRRVYNGLASATVHDLGCGIGADAVAMSALGVTVQGVDIDPVTAAIADLNLRPWPDSRARVGLAEEFEAPRDPLRSRVGVWLDPARRVPG